MKTKIIPFNLETAKKIQAGEIKGKIKYCEGGSYVYDAYIIKFDLIADKSKAKPNSTQFRTIVAIIEFDNYQGIRTFNTDGYGYNNNGDDTNLLIEVPDNEPQFKPFDKVLIRNSDDYEWRCDFFSHLVNNSEFRYVTISSAWRQCIPYEGNQDLVGKTDKSEQYD